MIESLAPVFQGPLAFARDVLSLRQAPGEGEAIPCTDLLRPEVLNRLLDGFAQRHGKADRRAVVSMWTQYYTVRLVYPVLAANLLLGRDLPVDLGRTALHVSEDGAPLGFCLADEGGAVAACGMERFAGLVRDHLAPLVVAVAAAGHVSPRLIWSNAGIRFAGVATVARRQDLLDAPAAADIASLLETPCWSDGWPNPIFQPYRDCSAEGGPAQRRRVCCLRHLLPDFDGCGLSCPLPAGRGELLTRN
jgi:ferric iron reductase protein FhuF